MSNAGAYPQNAAVKCLGTFTQDGVETDPTTIVVKVKTPSGAETTYTYGVDAEVTRVSTGVYRIDIVGTDPGRWRYEWTAPHSGEEAAGPGSFRVESSSFS